MTMIKKKKSSELLKYIIRSIVFYPNKVRIVDIKTDIGNSYLIKTHPQDVGRVIGKKGVIIEAIKTILNSYGMINHEHIHVQVDTSVEKEDAEKETDVWWIRRR